MPRNTTSFKIAGSETFRLASSEFLGRVGGNMQNISKEMRKMYIPDDGRIFIQCDQSGAEALIVAYLCKSGNYRQLFLSGIKPHTYLALRLFADKWKEKSPALSDTIDAACKLPIAEIKQLERWKELDDLIKSSDNWIASERYYFIAKMVVHASSYGMKAPTFQLNVLEKSEGKVVLSRKQAEDYLAMFHGLFPEIRNWHFDTERIVRDSGILYNLFGFPRLFNSVIRFQQHINESFLKEAYAFVPQSTVGCITHIALTKLQNYIEDNDLRWDILNNCHDSYLVQCPIDEADRCKSVMMEFIQIDLVSPRGEKFRMRAECQIGNNWAFK